MIVRVLRIAFTTYLKERSIRCWKGWLAIAKLKPLSLFISVLLMLKKALDNVKIEK